MTNKGVKLLHLKPFAGQDLTLPKGTNWTMNILAYSATQYTRQ
jgi:hypothetical protein